MPDKKPNMILKLFIGDYRGKSLWWWIFRVSLVVLLLLIVLFFIIGKSTSDTSGVIYSRESFVSLCAKGAQDDSANVDIKVYEDYCGCAFDKGVDK